MPDLRTALGIARTATLVVIVLVCGYAIATFIAQNGTPLPSFAGNYVAARVATSVSGSVPYNYGALLRLNDAHQYVPVGLYPVVAPPFALLAFVPLTLLPYSAASAVWLGIIRLCMFGAALALADAVSTMIFRREATDDQALSRTAAILRLTSPQFGSWRFPAVPFALAAVPLLLCLPLANSISWDSTAPVAAFFVALALAAYVRKQWMLAGLAVALAGGFSLLALVLVACFLVRGIWKVAAWTVFFSAAVAMAPLLFFPASSYGDFITAVRIAEKAFGSSDHNISLLGAVSTVILALGHMGTLTYIQASKAATYAVVVLVVATLLAFAVLPLLRSRVARTDTKPDADDTIWLGAAISLTTVVLALPLVWSDDSAFVVVAALLAGAYPYIRRRSIKARLRLVDVALVLASLTALILQFALQTFGLDATDLQLLDHREFLYLAHAVAAALIWATTIAALLLPYLRLLRRPQRQPRDLARSQELVPGKTVGFLG